MRRKVLAAPCGESVKLTADTITHEQVVALRKTRQIDALTFSLAVVGRGFGGPDREALARCAEILNARAVKP